MKQFKEDIKRLITPNVELKEVTNVWSKTKTLVFYIDNVPFVTTQEHLDFRRAEGMYEKDLTALKSYILKNSSPW